MTWRFVASGTELTPMRIGAINVWDHEWRMTGRRAEVIDPRHGQHFTFEVWVISLDGRTVEFAAGEFSNGMWGLYEEAP